MIARGDFDVNDLAIVFEMVAGVRVVDPESTRRLRHRYLALILDAIRPPSRSSLPGTPPTRAELEQRWRT